MSRREGPKVVAWAAVATHGEPSELAPMRKFAEADARYLARLHRTKYRVVKLVEADPDRDRHAKIGRLLLEERAAMRAYEYADTRDEREPASARHESARKRLAAALAAVEKLQRKGRK